MSTEKRENYASGSSDVEGVDSGAEDSAAAATTLPKKRGRPSKGEKVVKAPSGRGRGRPAKIAGPLADVSEESDGAVENGKKAPVGRGRQAKNGTKAKNIVATGKGRGRPKNATKRTAEDGEETSPKKDKGAAGKRGRPRKATQASDEEVSGEEVDVEEEEVEIEKAKLGRPNTGAVSLNIVRTGRGQGRPKKSKVQKRLAEIESGIPAKKRGRPAAAAKKVEEKTNGFDSKEDDDTGSNVSVEEDEEEEFEEAVVELSPDKSVTGKRGTAA